ncbi:MAG: hypothetical protein WAV54_05135 [Acidimicrobiales bacterium]
MDERPVFPSGVDLDAVRSNLGSMGDGPTPAAVVIDQLRPAPIGTWRVPAWVIVL